MPIASQERHERIDLPPGQVLIVTADAQSSGIIRRKSDTLGVQLIGANTKAIAPSSQIMIGPFPKLRHYNIEVSAGTLTYIVDYPDFANNQFELYPAGNPLALVGLDASNMPISVTASRLTLLPRNRGIFILGDSRDFQCSTIISPEYSKLAQGWIGFLQFLANQRFDFDINDNYGVSGNTTADMLARTPAMLAAVAAGSQAGTLMVLGGTNDRGAGISYAQSVANLTAIRDLALAAGKIVIFFNELPRGDAGNTGNRLTATQLRDHLRLRQWFVEQRSIPGVYVVDMWAQTADPTSATGDVLSALFKDALHENPTGAYYMAVQALPLIQQLFAPIDLLPYTTADKYDATNFPTGCLNDNPMMNGTAGTINGTGGSGSLADSYSENAGPTWTRAYSKVTSNGKAFQQIVLGGTGTTGGCAMRQVITAGNLAIGDKVYAVADVEIDANAANISQLALQLLDNNTVTAGDFRRALSTEAFPNVGAIKGVMRTPIYTLTSTTLQLQFEMKVLVAAVAATVRVGRIAVRKYGV